MKALMLKMSVMALSVVIMMGCASNSANDGPSDEDQITAIANGISDALKAKDIDAMLSFYSDDFSSDQGGSKAETKEFLEGAKAMGALDGIEIGMDEMKVVVDGDKAECGPVDLEASFGSIALDYELEKRNGKWIVVYMSQY